MFDIGSLSAPLRAAVLVGIVLQEALVLYAGYGGLFRVAGDEVVDAIEDA